MSDGGSKGRLAWLTPATLPTTTRCRRLFIPDSEEWVALVSGALVELTNPANWEAFGAVTPDEAAEQSLAMLLRYFEDDCMLGAIFPYTTSSPPTGCLPCDGSTYQRADYPALYTALNSVFVTGPDTFITPDLRGRTVIGGGQGVGLTDRATGLTGGQEAHSLTTDELPLHSHTTQPHGHTTLPHTHSEITATPTVINGGIEAPAPAATPTPALTGPATVVVNPETVLVDDTGGGQAHDNMPPFVALNYCLVAR